MWLNVPLPLLSLALSVVPRSQYDEMWAKHPGFVKYDYKKVDEVRWGGDEGMGHAVATRSAGVLVIRPTKAFPSGGATATPNACCHSTLQL